MRLGTTELLVVLLIVVILFGPTQIPKLTKMMGKSIKNLRDGMTEEDAPKAEAPAQATQQEDKTEQ